MRRTASCTIVVTSEELSKHDSVTPSQYRNVTEITNLISMNKKVRMEIGFTNFTGQYPTYDKIWFPLGTFVIKSANVAKSNGGINISLTLNDKCALLNGDIGGIIPAATVFSELESFNSDGTKRFVEKILIKDVIKFLLVDFAGEHPDNILITDIDDYIVKVMKWNGRETLYLYERQDGKGSLSQPLQCHECAEHACPHWCLSARGCAMAGRAAAGADRQCGLRLRLHRKAF
jgi:hypothetical protein